MQLREIVNTYKQVQFSVSSRFEFKVAQSKLNCKLRQYGLWSFQTGGTKLEIFLPKNQHTQRKLVNFEFWINGELSKSDKI